MVAEPDFKSGFETDSNPDLTKNWDPVWNPVFRFKTGLESDSHITQKSNQIHISQFFDIIEWQKIGFS